MKPAKFTPFLILTLILLVIGCGDSPISSPGGGEINPPPDGAATTFGLVEVTISGIGTDKMTASAQPATGNIAAALTRPSGSGGAHDGTIQIESISHGSFTTGSRAAGTGMRYLYATFRVRNADVDGNPYPNALQNLTFVAVDTDVSADVTESYGVTPISELRLFDGTLLTDGQATTLSEKIIPTGRVAHDPASPTGYRPYKADVLQVFTENEAAAISVPNGVTAFPYGFITRSPKTTPGSPKLPAGPGQYEFDGIVTFAYKMPLQAQANQDPFEINALFLPVDNTRERITQSSQEQTSEGNILLAARVAELNPDSVTIFPGSSYQAPLAQLVCKPVRVAGTPTDVTATLFPAVPCFEGGTITAGGHTWQANSGLIFETVTAGADLTSADFKININPASTPVTGVTFGGADKTLFSVEAIEAGGYTIKLDGPVLDYNHTANGQNHQYQFTLTAENAAGHANTRTIIIPVESPFAGGDGTAGNPYQVETLDQLQRVGQFLGAHFIQIADIDASPTSNPGWHGNGTKGFDPIGTFTGSYNGGGYEISGLTINRPNRDNVGLFGLVGTGGVIQDVHMTDADITSAFKTGTLVGKNRGTIKTSSATGSVSGGDDVGGLVGSNDGGTIETSYATGNVSGSSNVGGLVGDNRGTIQTSYATGSVSGNRNVGGLAGQNRGNGNIQISYATGKVTSTQSASAGGLVGVNNFGTDQNSYWDIDASGQSSSAGSNDTGLHTYQMVSTNAQGTMGGFDFGSVWQTNATYYPTLQANPQQNLPVLNPNLFAGGSGTAGDPYLVETLDHLQQVGQYLDAHFIQIADIDASPTSGWNSGKGFDPIGTFTGTYDGDGYTITGLTINLPSQDDVGLFSIVGTGGIIKDLHISGGSISGNNRVGGLVGKNLGTIKASSVAGDVSGNNDIGGLAGFNDGTIQTSYATGNISGNKYIGGLAGFNAGTIQTSYATGIVSGSNIVGGLAGFNGGTIQTTYATGKVTGSLNFGGLVGRSGGSSTNTNSYWDTQTTGQTSSAGGTGLTTNQMTGTNAQTNMTGFAFTDVWQTNPGDYPTLQDNP